MVSTPPKELLDVIKHHEHIVSNITKNWGSIVLDKFLTNLLLDTRDGTRIGFKPSEASAIHKLMVENSINIPRLPNQVVFDPWRQL